MDWIFKAAMWLILISVVTFILRYLVMGMIFLASIVCECFGKRKAKE